MHSEIEIERRTNTDGNQPFTARFPDGLTASGVIFPARAMALMSLAGKHEYHARYTAAAGWEFNFSNYGDRIPFQKNGSRPSSDVSCDDLSDDGLRRAAATLREVNGAVSAPDKIKE